MLCVKCLFWDRRATKGPICNLTTRIYCTSNIVIFTVSVKYMKRCCFLGYYINRSHSCTLPNNYFYETTLFITYTCLVINSPKQFVLKNVHVVYETSSRHKQIVIIDKIVVGIRSTVILGSQHSLLMCSVWILWNFFSFSCCLFDLKKDKTGKK